MRIAAVLLAWFLPFCLAAPSVAQESKAKKPAAKKPRPKVADDLKKFEESEYWIYNNLPKALERAKAEEKPLLVVIRCVP